MNDTTTPKPRKPHVRAVKAYEITDAAGLHIAHVLAKTPAAACELVRPQLQARMLTIVEAAQIDPTSWVTADTATEDTAP
jgi:hypothetical protein